MSCHSSRNSKIILQVSDLHGAGGEWRVESARLHWDILDAFRDAAVSAGIPATDDFNRGDNAARPISRSTRARHSLEHGQSLSAPGIDRKNSPRTGAHVRRIEIEELRATGVTFDQRTVPPAR